MFEIVSEDFFKPLTSKYKTIYIDCLRLIYNTYKTELSFGVDKEIILSELEQYFEEDLSGEMSFDEDEEIAKDSRAKANAILRRLSESKWIEYEMYSDYKIKVNLLDYAATMIESFNKIINGEEIEYQSIVSQIHGTLLNQEGYVKPYEYIIKRVIENTEELIIELKKLNSSIKKYIDSITNEKTAGEIIEDFFIYHNDVGSKAYHRIKTSDNISHFRNSIIENLNKILNDSEIFGRAVLGYMEIEQVSLKEEAEDLLISKIRSVISAFRNYDDIISEIDIKNSKYIGSAVTRANFLLNNTTNSEGKISKILAYLADEFNSDDNLNLYDEVDDQLFKVFNIFPQKFIDGDSLYVVPITKKMSLPEELSSSLGITEEQRKLRKLAMLEKNNNRFSRKNVDLYINDILKDKSVVLASTLPLETKRDLIRLIFIKLYGKVNRSTYDTTNTNEIITINNLKFSDYIIERRE